MKSFEHDGIAHRIRGNLIEAWTPRQMRWVATYCLRVRATALSLGLLIG